MDTLPVRLVEVVIFPKRYPNRRLKVATLLDLIQRRKAYTYAYSDSTQPTVGMLVTVPVKQGKRSLRGMIVEVSDPSSSIGELVESVKAKGLDPISIEVIDSTFQTSSPTPAESYLQGIIYKRLSKGLKPWESLNSIK